MEARAASEMGPGKTGVATVKAVVVARAAARESAVQVAALDLAVRVGVQ
jgi:hypothetical protein